MRGSEFLRRVERVAKERGITVRFLPRRGKGSHGTRYYGETLHGMLKQLGLTLADIE